MSFTLFAEVYKKNIELSAGFEYLTDIDFGDGSHAGALFGFQTSMCRDVIEVNPAVKELESTEFGSFILNFIHDDVSGYSQTRFMHLDEALAYYEQNCGQIPHKGYVSHDVKNLLSGVYDSGVIGYAEYSAEKSENTPNYVEWTEDYSFVLENLKKVAEEYGSEGVYIYMHGTS